MTLVERAKRVVLDIEDGEISGDGPAAEDIIADEIQDAMREAAQNEREACVAAAKRVGGFAAANAIKKRSMKPRSEA